VRPAMPSTLPVAGIRIGAVTSFCGWPSVAAGADGRSRACPSVCASCWTAEDSRVATSATAGLACCLPVDSRPDHHQSLHDHLVRGPPCIPREFGLTAGFPASGAVVLGSFAGSATWWFRARGPWAPASARPRHVASCVHQPRSEASPSSPRLAGDPVDIDWG